MTAQQMIRKCLYNIQVRLSSGRAYAYPGLHGMKFDMDTRLRLILDQNWTTSDNGPQIFGLELNIA